MKILYVGYMLMGDKSATGATLSNIFKSDEISVLQLCLDYDLKRHSKTFPAVCCDKYRSFLFYLLKSLYRHLVERKGEQSATISNVVAGHNKSVFISFCQGLLDCLPKEISPSSLRQLDDFSPDVIYTLGENISALQVSLSLSKRFNIPIVIHVMDDIESSIYNEGRSVSIFRQKYFRLLDRVYKKNHYHLAIGEKMAEEFVIRHHCSYDFVMNCIDKVYPSKQPLNNPLKIVFSGGLHGGRDSSLIAIAEVINNNNFLKKTFELHVYTSSSFVKSNGKLSKYCQVHEYVPANQVIKNMSSADILLHVESFDENEIKYFKYSMSTKIPEYLSVGRPIVGYGPADVNSISYLRDQKVGRVAQNEKDLFNALMDLSELSVREACGERAICVAEQFHTNRIVTQKMLKVFNQAITYYNEK